MEAEVKDHYHSRNLTQTIIDALEKARPGKPVFTIKDLAPIDQLHTGGANATSTLLNTAGIDPGARVLDAGCGIGGSSRLMATAFQFKVTGIDLAPSFIQTARALTERFDIPGQVSDQIRFQQGSILDMPFDNGSFDAILCQHVLMNIKDKKQAFKEFNRVLRPGGKLVLHEIVKGDSEPVIYPVPWADRDGISFLTPWPQMEKKISRAGFTALAVSDGTQKALGWWEKALRFSEKTTNAPPILGPQLVFGDNAKAFANTMHFNFQQDRIHAVEALFEKG